MGRLLRIILSIPSAVTIIASVVAAIRWAITDGGAARLSGIEIDQRLMVDVYAALAIASLTILVLLLGPLLIPLLTENFRTRSHRLRELDEEIVRIRQAIDYSRTPVIASMSDEEIYERLRQLERKLLGLEIPCPSADENQFDEWEQYLTRLSVLAEQSQYEEAKRLWEEEM